MGDGQDLFERVVAAFSHVAGRLRARVSRLRMTTVAAPPRGDAWDVVWVLLRWPVRIAGVLVGLAVVALLGWLAIGFMMANLVTVLLLGITLLLAWWGWLAYRTTSHDDMDREYAELVDVDED